MPRYQISENGVKNEWEWLLGPDPHIWSNMHCSSPKGRSVTEVWFRYFCRYWGTLIRTRKRLELNVNSVFDRDKWWMTPNILERARYAKHSQACDIFFPKEDYQSTGRASGAWYRLSEDVHLFESYDKFDGWAKSVEIGGQRSLIGLLTCAYYEIQSEIELEDSETLMPIKKGVWHSKNFKITSLVENF